jgi:anti-sigma regulatory factor (Ser/Thr protein kinase)
MFSAWGTRRRARGWPVRIDDTLKSPYAWKSGLLAILAGRQIPPSAKHQLPPSVFVSEHTMATKIDDLMEGLAIPDGSTEQAVQHAIEDLCRNVFHHAATNGEGAHVAASFDHVAGRVRIGVADCGRGIARDIRDNLGDEMTDAQAVRIAVEPEVSGSAQLGLNRGVGLYIVRRLALAAKGAFWIRTGRVLVTASSISPEESVPHVREVTSEWRGTAVAVTFHAGNIDDYPSVMAAITADIEGQGPRFKEVQFFRQAPVQPGWTRVLVPPDVAKTALDRDRAFALAREQIVPALHSGDGVIVDFSNTKMATQAFCHALVVPVCISFGADVLRRLRFVACSSQVTAMIRTGIHYALREQAS